MNQANHKLSDLEFGIICSIHQKPNYRFIANERKAACKMVDIGLLVPVINDKYRFVVTEGGEALYTLSIKYLKSSTT